MSLTLWQPKSADAKPLPEEWIKRLFQKLTARYGTLFMDRFAGVPQEVLLEEWAGELAGYSGEELQRGLDALRAHKFPPTLPEFMELCRPGIDAYVAFVEAMDNMAKRETGANPRWTHPAIYWAVCDVTHYEMRRTTYAVIAPRWQQALADQLRKGQWRPIPPAFIPLPAPRGTPAPPEVRAKFKELIARMKGQTDAPASPAN